MRIFKRLMSNICIKAISLTPILFSLSIIGSNLRGQEKGTVTGIVTDSASGESLQWVHISVEGTLEATTSQTNGSFTLKSQPGSFVLVVQYPGYRIVRENVEIVAGQTRRIDFHLERDAIRLSEMVTIVKRNRSRNIVSIPIETASSKRAMQKKAKRLQKIIQTIFPIWVF